MFKTFFLLVIRELSNEAIMHEAEHEVIQLRIKLKLEYCALRLALHSN